MKKKTNKINNIKPDMHISPYLKGTLLVLSIWVVALLMNAAFTMCWMHLFNGGEFQLRVLGFIIYFSAVFSSPGLLILWLTSMFYLKNENLFRIILFTSIGGSVFACLIVAVILSGDFSIAGPMLFISPVVMAALSVFMHKSLINKITENFIEPCIEISQQ